MNVNYGILYNTFSILICVVALLGRWRIHLHVCVVCQRYFLNKEFGVSEKCLLSQDFDPPSLSPSFWVTLQVLNRMALRQEGLTTKDITLRAVLVTLHHHKHMVSLPSV